LNLNEKQLIEDEQNTWKQVHQYFDDGNGGNGVNSDEDEDSYNRFGNSIFSNSIKNYEMFVKETLSSLVGSITENFEDLASNYLTQSYVNISK
jgi:hypothetical protein